jgi:TonB family protein
MLDDFRASSVAGAPRKRFVGSVVVAVGLYGAFGAALIAATADIVPPIEVVLEPVHWRRPAEPSPPAPAPPENARKPVTCMIRRATHPLPASVRKAADTPLPSTSEPEQAALGVAVAAAGVSTGDRPGVPEEPIAPAPAPVIRPRELPGNRYTDLEYPPRAMRAAISGIVLVEFDVLPDGHVADARILSGPVEFHETVLNAARSWRFEPARQAGRPVRYRLIKRIVFRLEDA